MKKELQIRKGNKDFKLSVEKPKSINPVDLEDLCDASMETMKDTMGFTLGNYTGASKINKDKMQTYWEGVMLVPEIILILGRLDGTISGSLQLVRPPQSNISASFSCTIENHFVAPWARGYGLSNMMLDYAEQVAKENGFTLIKLSVRETRERAIKVYEKRGYKRWGVLPKYELDHGKIVKGFFYYKEL